MAVRKTVSFREKGKYNDLDIIDWIEGKEFSYYIKGLIRKDIQENKEKEKPIRKRNIDFDF